MKKRTFLIITILSLSFIIPNRVNAQIGPVVSVSENQQSLPESIKTFLKTHFPNVATEEIKLKTLSSIYEVDLKNGYDLKFNTDGDWVEIEAPNNIYISHDLVYKLLPGEIYENLKKHNVVNKIKEIDFNPIWGYKIDINKKDDLYFNLNGNKTQRPQIFDIDD